MKIQSKRNDVRDALQRLCLDAPSPAQILFRTYFSAAAIARAANCSETCARRHLDNLAQYRDYSSRVVHHVRAYRYDAPP